MIINPNLYIVRLEQTVEGALGALLIGGKAFCWTLHPDITDDHFQIPADSYIYRRYSSKKYPNTFEILVRNHSGLVFHPGNLEVDTEGCTLLGTRPGNLLGERAILDSKVAFKLFMARMEGSTQGIIKIIDFYQERRT